MNPDPDPEEQYGDDDSMTSHLCVNEQQMHAEINNNRIIESK